MIRQVRLTPKARADIDAIRKYSEKEWGKDQAIKYIRTIHAVLQLIDSNPGIARKAEDIRPGLLKYPAGSHLIFFRLTEEAIDIVRILHKRMDMEAHF